MTKEILYKEFLQDIRELVTTNYDDPLIREVQETHMKNLLLEKYSPTLGFNGGDIKRFIDLVRKKDNLSEDTSVEEDTGEDLLERLKADSFEENTYFSPLGLPKSGVILLAARSKVGKTLFAWDLVKGVAAKGTFLGLPVMKGDIVLFMLEESVSSMNSKLRTLGFNNPLVKNQLELHKVTLYKTLDISRSLQRLENIIESKKPIITHENNT